MKPINLTGQKFGKLTALYPIPNAKPKRKWHCKCDCGETVDVITNCLTSGNTKSCGCRRGSPVHNLYRTPTYSSWQSMKSRCLNENDPNYSRYGGRGITVCQSWQDSFNVFVEDMGLRPDGHCIERVDNEQGYNPENCKWATMKEQGNNRSTCHLLTFKGKTQNVTQWANELGLKRNLIYARLSKGWDVERCLTA